jgi:hypothetical protein
MIVSLIEKLLFSKTMINSIERHALTGIGGWLVAHSYATNSEWQTVVGGIGAATGIILSLWAKRADIVQELKDKVATTTTK